MNMLSKYRQMVICRLFFDCCWPAQVKKYILKKHKPIKIPLSTIEAIITLGRKRMHKHTDANLVEFIDTISKTCFGRFCRKEALPNNNLQNAEHEIHQLESCVVVRQDGNQPFGNTLHWHVWQKKAPKLNVEHGGLLMLLGSNLGASARRLNLDHRWNLQQYNEPKKIKDYELQNQCLAMTISVSRFKKESSPHAQS